MMKDLQKMGGIAALYQGAAYVLGIVFFVFLIDYSGDIDVASLVDNQVSMFIMTLLVFVVWGVFMVFLSLALHDRLKAGSPAMAQAATVFGLIWAGLVIASGMIFIIGMGNVIDLYGTDPAQAATVWLAIDSVFDGIGGGVEFVGGVWILLVSWAALRAGELPRVLNYLGVVIGVVGILTVVPALGMLTDIFGLTQIVWFIWLGIVMLRDSQTVTA
jgi:hypothetical protein